ncbi:MAG: thioesterase family protein [Candidatus Omnitrophota bacterium]
MRHHETEIRVRYKETDQMGVVYYSNYFVWFEVARTEYLRAMGLAYSEIEKRGLRLMVARADCTYLSPARYDDMVTVSSWIPEIRNSSLTFEYKISVGDRPVATGKSVHVFTDPSAKPVRIPKDLKDILGRDPGAGKGVTS